MSPDNLQPVQQLDSGLFVPSRVAQELHQPPVTPDALAPIEAQATPVTPEDTSAPTAQELAQATQDMLSPKKILDLKLKLDKKSDPQVDKAEQKRQLIDQYAPVTAKNGQIIPVSEDVKSQISDLADLSYDVLEERASYPAPPLNFDKDSLKSAATAPDALVAPQPIATPDNKLDNEIPATETETALRRFQATLGEAQKLVAAGDLEAAKRLMQEASNLLQNPHADKPAPPVLRLVQGGKDDEKAADAPKLSLVPVVDQLAKDEVLEAKIVKDANPQEPTPDEADQKNPERKKTPAIVATKRALGVTALVTSGAVHLYFYRRGLNMGEDVVHQIQQAPHWLLHNLSERFSQISSSIAGANKHTFVETAVGQVKNAIAAKKSLR